MERLKYLDPGAAVKSLLGVQGRDHDRGSVTEEVVRHARHKPGAVCGTGSTFVPKLQGVRSELLPPKVQDYIVQELQNEAGAGPSSVAGRQAGVLQTLDQGQEGTVSFPLTVLDNFLILLDAFTVFISWIRSIGPF